jgi:uncharacterized membrane protein
MKTFGAEVFLAFGHQLVKNVSPVMTILMPAALLSIPPVLIRSYQQRPSTFYVFFAGFVLFVAALLVTLRVEVPISKQVETWTIKTLPDNWQQLRDRWGAFHVVRVVVSILGLALLVGGAIL